MLAMLANIIYMIIQFMLFGVTGWCMEILWTGLHSLFKKDYKLIATTSIWMFFIYGMAVFLKPLCDVLLGMSFPLVLRGGIYMLCIFAAEFTAGFTMKRLNACPWDYSDSRFNVLGLIRLDYAPVWFAAGLVMEALHARL